MKTAHHVIRHIFRRILSAYIVAAAISVGVLIPSIALSQATGSSYVDHGVFPGEKIVNTVEVFLDGNQMTTASTTIVVQRFPVNGSLRIFELDYGLGAGPVERWDFPRSAHASSVDGPFTDLPSPRDYSALTGGHVLPSHSGVGVVETTMIRQGVPVFFVLSDRSFNLRPDTIDTVAITIRDLITGDIEVILLTETSPDSGDFTGWIETNQVASTQSNGLLSTTGFSQITASYVDINNVTNELNADITVGPVDPFGFVFDSVTGELINGVTVTLLDITTGQPAVVVGNDLVSAYPSTVVTGQTVTDSSGATYNLTRGEYRFPFVFPGTYRLILELPEGYDAPSTATDADIAALSGNFVIDTGSRLEPFDVVPGPPIHLDIPVDLNRDGGIVRNASIDVAEIGELFEYDVQIIVPDTGIIDITDTLPAGIRYVPGTLTIDGRRIDPVMSANGRILVIGGFATRPGANIRMTYTAQVQAGSSTRAIYGSSTVTAETGTGRLRLRGRHDLRVKDAFGMEDIVILGQVVAGGCGKRDIARNMSGIRVLLETGDYAITDEEGKFHFRDIPHRPRVVQMDTNTLPAHATPVLCRADTRNAGSAISRFVDVRPGMMGRVEFYVAFDEAAEAQRAEEVAATSVYAPVSPTEAYTQDWIDRQGEVTEARILTPSKGMLPISDVVDVLVLRPVGTTVEAVLNGQDVEPSRKSLFLGNKERSGFIDRFRALRLQKGENRIQITVKDENDDVLLQETRTVLNATDIAGAELVSSGSILESDGRTTPVVSLRLTSSEGHPIRPGTIVQVTVDEPFAFMPEIRRRSEDAISRQPSKTGSFMVQGDGIIKMTLAPALETWNAKFQINTDDDVVTQRVKISAAERPWVLVGLAEGTLGHRTIRDNMRRSGDIGNDLSGRVSLFAEGVIRGEWLLTLRYDSARDGKGEFSGIDPDRDYVVYGDRSFQNDAAKSRFPLYLRLRKENVEFLVGDFDTKIDTNLVNLNRNLTGARAIMETETYRVMAFAAKTSQRFIEDRIVLDGTAGPYDLSRRDIVQHSENVRLIEVSRIDPSEEISSETLEAGRDYIVSSGQIFLRGSRPAFSSDLNRYVLIVEYETDEDVEDGMMAGIRAEAQVSERVRVGGTVIHARNIDGQPVRVTLIGGDIAFSVTEDLTLTAEAIEVRKSFADRTVRGNQAELRAQFDDGTNRAEAYIRSQRGNVGINADTDDVRTDTAGATASILLKRHWTTIDDIAERYGIYAEGTYFAERDRLRNTKRRDSEIFIVNRNAESERAIGIVERRRETPELEQTQVHIANRASWSTPDDFITWGLGLEYAVKSEGISSRDRILMSMAVKAAENVTVFTTYEGEIERSTKDVAGILSFGAEYTFGEQGIIRVGAANAFNRNSGAGQSLFMGLDNGIQITDSTLFSFGMDAHKDLGADDIVSGLTSDNPLADESFVAVRAGLRHTRETWSIGVDTEYRSAESGDRGNIRLSADGEINDRWSIGGDMTVGTSTENALDRNQLDIRMSAAHRGDDRDPITLITLESSLDEGNGRSNQKIIGSVLHTRYLSDASSLSVRYAGRQQIFTGLSGISSTAFTNFVGAEYRHDITSMFDIGLHGSLMDTGRASASSYGVSVGVSPFKNSWVSIGYNFDGFRDDDFSAGGYTNKGAFIQLRVKFDQNTIKDMFR